MWGSVAVREERFHRSTAGLDDALQQLPTPLLVDASVPPRFLGRAEMSSKSYFVAAASVLVDSLINATCLRFLRSVRI